MSGRDVDSGRTACEGFNDCLFGGNDKELRRVSVRKPLPFSCELSFGILNAEVSSLYPSGDFWLLSLFRKHRTVELIGAA